MELQYLKTRLLVLNKGKIIHDGWLENQENLLLSFHYLKDPKEETGFFSVSLIFIIYDSKNGIITIYHYILKILYYAVLKLYRLNYSYR